MSLHCFFFFFFQSKKVIIFNRNTISLTKIFSFTTQTAFVTRTATTKTWFVTNINENCYPKEVTDLPHKYYVPTATCSLHFDSVTVANSLATCQNATVRIYLFALKLELESSTLFSKILSDSCQSGNNQLTLLVAVADLPLCLSFCIIPHTPFCRLCNSVTWRCL